MLALDFDGVVVDALTECGAITWYGGSGHRPEAAPGFPEALQHVPAEFLATFAEVRAYSRTLDDFMVTHALHPRSSRVDREVFERARRDSDQVVLSAQAARAEDVRRTWRKLHFDDWIALHTVHPQMARLIQDTAHRVVVVSAKDPESIRAILAYHHLDAYIDLIVGSCQDRGG